MRSHTKLVGAFTCLSLLIASVAQGQTPAPKVPSCVYLLAFIGNPKRALDANQTQFLDQCMRANIGVPEDDCKVLEGAIQASTNRLSEICGWVFPDRPQSFCEDLSNNPDRKQVIGLLISHAENRALALRCAI